MPTRKLKSLYLKGFVKFIYEVGIDNVMSELRDNAETQFDPEVVDIILKGKVSLE